MSRNWKERVVGKLLYIIKKHRLLKAPVWIGIFFVTFIWNIIHTISSNTKRLSSIAAVCLIFVISSSFSFPVFSEDYAKASIYNDQLQISSELKEDSYEYVSDEKDISDDDLLDDEDVLEGYDNQELDTLDIMSDEERFSLDDILKDNNEINENAVGEVQKSDVSLLSADDWQLVLINKQHPVPDDYTFNLAKITGNMQCDERIRDDLLAMMQGARKDGVNLVICSPYRDMSRQTMLFDRKINNYMGRGYSYMEAYKIASQTVTVPGASEHQIGLAVDIICDNYSLLDAGFGDTDAGKWLREHGEEYGFILRYPSGKEYITGIEYEPWHFRYVGKVAATEIMENDLCLEEFVEDLK